MPLATPTFAPAPLAQVNSGQKLSVVPWVPKQTRTFLDAQNEVACTLQPRTPPSLLELCLNPHPDLAPQCSGGSYARQAPAGDVPFFQQASEHDRHRHAARDAGVQEALPTFVCRPKGPSKGIRAPSLSVAYRRHQALCMYSALFVQFLDPQPTHKTQRPHPGEYKERDIHVLITSTHSFRYVGFEHTTGVVPPLCAVHKLPHH